MYSKLTILLTYQNNSISAIFPSIVHVLACFLGSGQRNVRALNLVQRRDWLDGACELDPSECSPMIGHFSQKFKLFEQPDILVRELCGPYYCAWPLMGSLYRHCTRYFFVIDRF